MSEHLVPRENLCRGTFFLGNLLYSASSPKGWLCFPRCWFVKEAADKPRQWEDRQVCQAGCAPAHLSLLQALHPAQPPGAHSV